jgi:hypothetical protein
LKLHRHDAQPRPQDPTTPGPAPHRPGRPQDRARLLLPETLSDLTGLVPGVTVRLWVTADGTLHLRALPGQDGLRLAWQAQRLLRIKQAQDLQAWAIAMSLAGRAPYAEISRSARKARRRIEATRGIPRDWPHAGEIPDHRVGG